MLTTQEVAQKLVTFCNAGQYEQAQKELYAQDAESLEQPFAPNSHVKGLDAILEKNKQFGESVVEIHQQSTSEPMISGRFFSVVMYMDVTHKESGREAMEEICLYEVKDGKIVKEQFFY